MIQISGRVKKFDEGFPAEEGTVRNSRESPSSSTRSTLDDSSRVPKGSLDYIQYRIQDGDLSFLVDWLSPEVDTFSGDPVTNETFVGRQNDKQGNQVYANDNTENTRRSSISTTDRKASICKQIGITAQKPRVMVISLHSCGNLIHHGLRSLLLNDFVVAVALVGCCYNLLTERLGPPSFKLPSLRLYNPRLVKEQLAYDPHGFPMSERLVDHEHKRGRGIRFNITGRMMAVQAPQNWTSEESDAFLTRHYFRALLQRIFFDRGIVQSTAIDDIDTDGTANLQIKGTDPIIIGSLRKSCYSSFTTYVRGAVAKLATDPIRGQSIQARMSTLTDEEIAGYEAEYRERKKELSIVWSLMALSAGVVEATIVVDRWLFLREQKEVDKCWVETVFDYKQSPRNLVVVGTKKG